MLVRFVSLVTIVALLAGVSGCVTVSEEHQGAAKGAGYGGAAGAIAGALLAGEGSRTKGAILGGLAGALLGGVVGNYTVDQKKSAAATNQAYNYQPASGVVTRIEKAAVNPISIAPGGKVDLMATYAVMAPSPESQVAVTESFEIRFNNELVGSPEVRVNHTPGTYTASVPLTLPEDAQKGTYKVLMTIKTEMGKDAKEATFTVK